MSDPVQGSGGTVGRSILRQGWRNVRAAGPRRLAITIVMLLMALLLARFSWHLPVTADAEHSLFDLRAIMSAPQVDQDPRVQIVSYDDQTLIALRKRSPLDRGLLAAALRNMDPMGAKAIGVDMLFDQPQDEDEDLIATLRAMKTPVFIAYADIVGNRDDITFCKVDDLAGHRVHEIIGVRGALHRVFCH